jgi:hypothetical protein
LRYLLFLRLFGGGRRGQVFHAAFFNRDTWRPS